MVSARTVAEMQARQSASRAWPVRHSAFSARAPLPARPPFSLGRRRMEPGGGRRERLPPALPPPQAPPSKAKDASASGSSHNSRLEKAKQRAAQQELKQRQRAEIYALNRVMTELEQEQFDAFCKQMQASGE